MKRAVTVFLLILYTFTLPLSSACTKKTLSLEDLRGSFLSRGEGVSGLEVCEIEEFDTFFFFCVRLWLQPDEEAYRVDDVVWFEAYVYYFPDAKEAEEVYAKNQTGGVGGESRKEGNFLLSWTENDPFADFYQDVFLKAFENQ